MTFNKGQPYAITNALNKNSALLPTPNQNQPVQGQANNNTDRFKVCNNSVSFSEVQYSADGRCFVTQWLITELGNNRCTIQHIQTKNYAYVSPQSGVNTQVVGKSDSREWRIVPTNTPGRYTYVEFTVVAHGSLNS